MLISHQILLRKYLWNHYKPKTDCLRPSSYQGILWPKDSIRTLAERLAPIDTVSTGRTVTVSSYSVEIDFWESLYYQTHLAVFLLAFGRTDLILNRYTSRDDELLKWLQIESVCELIKEISYVKIKTYDCWTNELISAPLLLEASFSFRPSGAVAPKAGTPYPVGGMDQEASEGKGN